ncbi:MAG: hypothetical protein A2132_03715 [Nitrospirae bacterium RBG_16_43_11]|nr:MAG: hypothetical protein A2132_03715 [Nitrospirae bacterium RBG_16_43_11]
MKKILFLFLTTFLIFNTAFAEEENKQPPPLSPLPQGEGKLKGTPALPPPETEVPPVMEGDAAEETPGNIAVLPPPLTGGGEHVLSEIEGGKGEGEEELPYTPAGQVEQPEEILFTPVPEEVLYSPVREPEKLRGKFHAEVNSTFQIVDLDTNSSKAQEYRKLTDGFYIRDFALQYETQEHEIHSAFRNVAPLFNIIDDGHGDLNYRRYGIIDVNLNINKFLHDYTNDAESLFTPVNPYTYRIPESATGATSFDASTRRDNYDLKVRLTPGDRLTITTSLSVENREGRRPITLENLTISAVNPAATPTAITEIAEPTDFTSASIALGLEYSDDIIDMQLNNNVQVFANKRPDQIIWDNPWQSGAYGSARTADDYTVHTLSFKPSIRLSDNIRLVNSLSYSRVTNSINLAPFTTVDGVGGTFQRDVLDPDVRSLNVSSTLTTMLFPDIRLNVKYRYYAYENDTPEIEDPPAYVMLDGSSIKYSRNPRYTSNISRSLGIDGNWYITDRLSIDAGIEDKGMPRREREVKDQHVESAFITVNSVLSQTLSALIGYRYERARGNYDTTYYKSIYDPDPLNDVNQHQLMRAFDLSESDTQSAKTGINFLPWDILNLSASLSVKMGEHTDVIIGRRSSQAESASISAELAPFKYLQFYSHYFHDRTTIESRYSWTYDSTLSGSEFYPFESDPLYPGFINPVSETIEDTSNNYVIGFDFDAYEKIFLTGNYSRYKSTGTSVSMPAVSSATDSYELKISYRPGGKAYNKHLSFMQLKDLRISAGYYSETYTRNDYALDFPDPVDEIVISDPQDIFLGIREPAYRLNIFSLTLGFYF